jgi:hypothetical protein
MLGSNFYVKSADGSPIRMHPSEARCAVPNFLCHPGFRVQGGSILAELITEGPANGTLNAKLKYKLHVPETPLTQRVKQWNGWWVQPAANDVRVKPDPSMLADTTTADPTLGRMQLIGYVKLGEHSLRTCPAVCHSRLEVGISKAVLRHRLLWWVSSIPLTCAPLVTVWGPSLRFQHQRSPSVAACTIVEAHYLGQRLVSCPTLL